MIATRSMVLAAIGAASISCSAGKVAVTSGGNVPPAALITTSTAPASTPSPEPTPAPPPTPADSRVDFASQIRPFLETDCAPCHFEGGKMYKPLPFDQGATIRLLGADKMFTRVKDEHKQALIRAFLAQQDPA